MHSGENDNAHGGSGSKATDGAVKDLKDTLEASPLGDFEGTLVVDLVKAKNLVKADIIGKSDPYAILKFGKQQEKTNTIKNTLEPQWDHHAEFKVPDGNANKLLVEVFDADKLGKDKSLGKVEVDILDLAADEGRWFPLQGKVVQLFLLEIYFNCSSWNFSMFKHFICLGAKSGEILLNADLLPLGSLDLGKKSQEDAKIKGNDISLVVFQLDSVQFSTYSTYFLKQ